MISSFARACLLLAAVVVALGAHPLTAQVPLPNTVAELPGTVQDPPKDVAPPGSTRKREKSALLPLENRKAIWARLEDVRKEIEETEGKMFTLSKPEDGSLVTSRERWLNELDRIQSEIRLAEKDLAEAETKKVEMKKREEELRIESEKEQSTDAALVVLRKKLNIYEGRRALIKDRVDGDYIKEKSKFNVEDSIVGEIIDAEMEIAQREESLRRSYKGGQADQIVKELADMKTDAEVKKSARDALLARFEKVVKLSDSITEYAKLERRVEMLQILHRKLSELNAQQEVEYLKSIDLNKKKLEVAGAK